ncbi:hypothetical protein OAF45_00875 [Candidatus Latescibacteria bacterium]|nr:hypothetical protein [Candidatus Latescibacterota bacterium]
MISDFEQIVRTDFDRLLKQRQLSVCEELLSADPIDYDAGPNSEPGSASTKACRRFAQCASIG